MFDRECVAGTAPIHFLQYRPLKRTILALIAAAFLAPGVDAASTSGRFTTAFYSFERAFQDTATVGSLRAYQTGRLKIKGIGQREALSFQAYGRVSHDFQDYRSSDPAYRLYHAYFRWDDPKERFQLLLGRQSVFSGVGIGRIDGARISGKLRGIRLEAYGGALVYGGQEGLGSLARASMVGVRVRGEIRGTGIGVSAFRRSRELTPYTSQARIIEGLPGTEIRPGEVEQQLIGLDVSRTAGRLLANIRWDISTPNGWETRRFEADLKYRVAGWTVGGSFLYRTPYVDQNSVFSVFTQSSNKEVGFRVSRRVNRHLALFTDLVRTGYDGAVGYRAYAGVNVLNGTLGYVRRSGFAGSADGLTGVIRHRLSNSLLATLSSGYSRFLTHSGTGTRSRIWSNTIGIVYRPGRALSLSFQGQSLSQNLESTVSDPFPGAGHDLRLFVSAATWFFRSGR